MDFSAGIARFGDILDIEGKLVEIGPGSLFGNTTVGAPAGSQREGVCASLNPLAPTSWGLERGAQGA